MAKVIKRGLPKKEFRYHFTCCECDSVIEFMESDTKSDQREGTYVVCPVCTRYIDWETVKADGKIQ